MKLLIVSQYFYPEQFRINDVCAKLAAMGHQVTVLTGLPNYPSGKIFDGFDWEKLKKSPGYLDTIDAYVESYRDVRVIRSRLTPRGAGKKQLALNYLSFWKNGVKTAKAMAKAGPEYDFDRILVFQYSPVTMALPAIAFRKANGKNIPLYLYCFDLWPESIVSGGLAPKGAVYDGAKALSTYIYKKADKLLVSSQNFEKYFKEKHNIQGKVEYLPIYAEDLFNLSPAADDDDDDLNPTEDKAAKSQSINLLFAGNIGEMQSVDTILRAAYLLQEKNVDNIHIDILGDGSAYEACLKLKKTLHLSNVTFYGRHPLEEMPEFYRLADAFLVTLKDDPFISYTLPGKVQSYMAAGKPILASIGGETAKVIEESGCGFACAPESHRGLADCMLRFASLTEKERRQQGALSKAYYEKFFSEKAFFAHLEEIL